MANNTNAQAILFSNSKIRPLADQMRSLYNNCKSIINQWNSQGLGALIPSDANPIQDGATVASGTPDGRTPILDSDINVLFAKATDLVNYFEGATATGGTLTNNASFQNLNQITKVAVNGQGTL